MKSYGAQWTYRYEILLEELKDMPDTQKVAILAGLERWAEQKDDLRLRYGMQLVSLSAALERNIGDTSGFEKRISTLVLKLTEEGMDDLKAEALHILGIYYWRAERYPESFEKHIASYNIYHKFAFSSFPAKPEYLRDFGGRYFYFKDYTTAAMYIKAGYLANPGKKDGYIFTLLNTLSLCYLYTDELDTAEYYMKKVYALAERKADTTWMGIVSGNMGMLYHKLNKPDEALYWFGQEIGSLRNKASMNVANSYAVMAEIYITKGAKEKALELARKAYEILQANGGFNSNQRASSLIYLGLAKASAANGDMTSAYHYLDSGMVAKDSISRKANAHILTGVGHKMSASQRLMEQEKYDQEARNYKLLRNVLITAIVLIVIIAILVYNRQRLKHKFYRQQLEAEKRHVETELQVATQQLGGLVGNITEKNDLIEKFTAELERLRGHLSEEKLYQADETLTHLQRANVITDEEWERFVQMFHKVHKGFTERLNEKVRGLSPIEMKFIMLSKMKLSTNEIASALGVSAESVRLNRKRLHAKLGLEETESSLAAFIDKI